MNFSSFKLHTQIMAGRRGGRLPDADAHPQQAIPPVLEGKDVMGLAQPGTGKTAAFVLPILERLLPGPRKMVRALIIAPTRELAEQINDNIIILGAKTNIRSATVYGGVGLAPQVQKLKAGTEIIVACPGRLLDHLNQKNADLSHLDPIVHVHNGLEWGFLSVCIGGPNPVRGAALGRANPGATVAYNPNTRVLSLGNSVMDILNLDGSDQMDPSFASDPILGATISISDFTMLTSAGGAYLFEGGKFTIVKDGTTFFEADVPYLLIDEDNPYADNMYAAVH